MEGILLDTMFDLPSLEGVEEVVISKEVVEGTARPLYIYSLAPATRTRAHRRTSLAACRLRDQGLKHSPRPSAIVSNFPQPAVLRLLPTRETLARQHARWPRRISLRDGGQRDRACVATGGLHTFVRTQQRRRATRTVTSRARRRDGLNTKYIMPRKLARHNRSSSGARRRLRTTPAMVAELPNAFGKSVILLTYWKPGRPRANMTRSLPDGRL